MLLGLLPVLASIFDWLIGNSKCKGNSISLFLLIPEINDSAWIAVCESSAALMSTSCKAVTSILSTGGFCFAGVGRTISAAFRMAHFKFSCATSTKLGSLVLSLYDFSF
ncbi:hypothetical protein T10_2856 [Trichinella papuae]|uniref:Secreted protein n=1 Tax=Trichinella papuae TaxID=268474 RepID=A0A0V1NAA7_9BILA|nr:hypothetical protein T10_2856 [Trichinella papuae]